MKLAFMNKLNEEEKSLINDVKLVISCHSRKRDYEALGFIYTQKRGEGGLNINYFQILCVSSFNYHIYVCECVFVRSEYLSIQ